MKNNQKSNVPKLHDDQIKKYPKLSESVKLLTPDQIKNKQLYLQFTPGVHENEEEFIKLRVLKIKDECTLKQWYMKKFTHFEINLIIMFSYENKKAILNGVEFILNTKKITKYHALYQYYFCIKRFCNSKDLAWTQLMWILDLIQGKRCEARLLFNDILLIASMARRPEGSYYFDNIVYANFTFFQINPEDQETDDSFPHDNDNFALEFEQNTSSIPEEKYQQQLLQDI